MLREEDSNLQNITIGEVKQLLSFVKEKSGVVSQELYGSRTKNEEIEL